MAATQSGVRGPVAEDHRVRVGRERSARMRERLLASVMEVCSNETARAPASIDDVVRHAGVARGTFYKYFDTLDQAALEVARNVGADMIRSIGTILQARTDPVERAAAGFMFWLVRATTDRGWGAFVLRMRSLHDGELFMRRIRSVIAQGMESGDFDVPSGRVALNALMGIKYQAIKQLLSAPPTADYVRMAASMALRSLGVPALKADRTVARAYRDMLRDSPGAVSWWQDPPDA